MHMKFLSLAVLFVLLGERGVTIAQGLEHRLHLSQYESALSAGFPLTLWPVAKLYHPDTSFRTHDRGWKNPIDAAARKILHDRLFQNHEGVAKTISDQLRNALVLYPLLYFPRNNAPRYEFHGRPFSAFDDARFFLSYLEAHSVTFFTTQLTKFLAQRQRPWVAYRNFCAPLYQYADATHGNVSFFSGHASAAFVSASFHHRMLQRFQGKNLGDAEVWSVYLAAALTGVMRIGADKHYFTDVLTGAVVGTVLARWVVDLSDYEIVAPREQKNAALPIPLFAWIVEF